MIKEYFEQIKYTAFINELKKTAMVKTYDPRKGPPPKPIKHESVDIPIVHLRDDAGEQGAISAS